MAKNLIVNGATYNAVESIEIPLSGGGGNAVFPDTSDANAVAANIANGKTAYVNAVKVTGTATGGGTDTSSGTATADQILDGEIAWVDGEEIEGTMPNNAGDVNAVSYHQSGTSLHIVPAEGYTDGTDDAVVITDSDFTAANIANGVSIFGLTGTLTGGSILMGDVTPASSVRGISVTHNFGAIPSHVFFCCLDQTVTNKKCYYSGGGIPNVSHFYFVRAIGYEIDFQARTNALTGASDGNNPCAICDLTTTTMTIGNTGQENYVLEAGVKYYWLMW